MSCMEGSEVQGRALYPPLVELRQTQFAKPQLLRDIRRHRLLYIPNLCFVRQLLLLGAVGGFHRSVNNHFPVALATLEMP